MHCKDGRTPVVHRQRVQINGVAVASGGGLVVQIARCVGPCVVARQPCVALIIAHVTRLKGTQRSD
ncbi:hypothetical protein B375_0211290 [Xylella fastidiosa 6c]|nr:hypothetical protein B375_0211290 [Xylella fastidiosa 6c]